MSGLVPIRELIKHEIGGGWGESEPVDGSNAPAFVIRGTDIPRVALGETATVPLRFHKPSALPERLLRHNDIVFEVSGGSKRQPVGRALLVDQRLLDQLSSDAICASFCKLIRLDSAACNPRFVFRCLQAEYAAGQLDVFQVQSTGITNLRWKPFLAQYKIELPPSVVQDRVSRVLDAMDDLIEINRRRVEVLEEMARVIYREWFVHFRFPGHEDATFVNSDLGPIPEGWSCMPLFTAADVGFGFSFKSHRFADMGPFPVIRIRNVPAGTTDVFTDEIADERYRVVDGDILIGMDGEFYVAQWSGGEAWLNQRVARLRPKGGFGYRYLMLAVEQPIRDWNNRIVGTTVAHLGKKHLDLIKVAVPEPDIIERLDHVLEPTALLVRNLLQQNRSLARTRDLLLPKLVTGQIDVSDLDLDAVVEQAGV